MTPEILIIFVLLVANGVFAMSEIAVVTARKVRLQQRAEAGDRRAAAALRLKADPTWFLSTVQVGITLIGILVGAYSGTTLTGPVAAWLTGIPLIAAYSEGAALAIVVSAITYFSLVIGELVPKAIALHDPERIAGLVATPVAAVARLATPVVKLLTVSTNVVLMLLRVKPAERNVTEEEIRALLKQATQTGDVELLEQEIVEQVFRLGDRRVSAIMTPRHDIDWLDIAEGLDGVRRHLAASGHPRLLMCDADLDAVLGVINAEEVLGAVLAGGAVDLRAYLKAPVFVPATLSAFKLLEAFRGSRVHLALVLDEFGAIEGLVTPTDIFESLVGEIPKELEGEDAPIVRRDDRSWLVDGTTPIDDLERALGVPVRPEEEAAAYETVAGLVMTRLARVPRTGDRFTWNDLRFEVVDMDGRRVDKVLVERDVAAPEGARG